MDKTKNVSKSKSKAKAYDPENSKTKLLVEYHKPFYGLKKMTYHSYLKYDKISKEKGMEKLRKLAVARAHLIHFAAIFDNISGEQIELIIKNGKIL